MSRIGYDNASGELAEQIEMQELRDWGRKVKDKKKIENEIFDREVLKVLASLMNKKIIKQMEFPISKGKEAYVFRAQGGENAEDPLLAVKIYMIETSRFKNMFEYIQGDPRFVGVKREKKDIVYAWTRKEYRNLKLCSEAKVHVPTPHYFQNNVLVIQFIGDEDIPAPQLNEVGPPDPKKNFRQLVRDMRKMYRAGLVHADLSPFNILVWGGELFIIDVGQGVALEHPMAESFLERDVYNVTKYFNKFGVKADKEKILKEIKGIK